MAFQQLELDLWQELQDAAIQPEAANLLDLCQLLERTISTLPHRQQLAIAGDAIEQMAQLYTVRAEWLLAAWQEVYDPPEPTLPVVAMATIDAWVRQSMAVDLDGFVEQPVLTRQRQPKSEPGDTVVVEVAREALLELVALLEADQAQNPREMLVDLAGDEQVSLWIGAIRRGLEGCSVPMSVLALQQRLQMPLVELWLGLLLGGFGLEQRGEFYSSDGLWVSQQCCDDIVLVAVD